MYTKQAIDSRIHELQQLQRDLQIDINTDVKRFFGGDASFVPYSNVWDRTRIEQFHDTIREHVAAIPDSNGSRYYEKIDVQIGIIADEFLYNAFKDVAHFTYITADNFEKNVSHIDVLLVVSTWRGLDNEWRGLANENSNRRAEIHRMIAHCKRQKKKVVFYSKEDPVNYDRFIGIAQDCEYIFTSAAEKVADYKRDCKTDKVFQLSFGVNPQYHNPVGMKDETVKKEVLFTGSWMEKYPERNRETETLFDGSLEAGKQLVVVDRNYSVQEAGYQFPEKYHPFVHPSIPHGLLQKYHKLFTYAINLNSVQYSDTMFANRIYELQAIGNILFSNYSVGVNNLFPNVFVINEAEEVGHIIRGMGEEERYRHRINGIRNVMSNHTTYHRIAYMLGAIGIDVSIKQRTVAVVVEKLSTEVVDNFTRQTYAHKTLFLAEEFTKDIYEDFDMVTYFSADNTYDMHYLEDMINGFVYTDSDFITKDSRAKGVEFDYVDAFIDEYRTVFWTDSYPFEQSKLEFTDPKQGFAIDRLNFHEQRPEKETLESTYALTVIVPVYNNGYFLENKCFPSLRRSSMFPDMEILLIDDGSTDRYTTDVIDRLEREYNNVRSFCFSDGGSGSASRPRNKGMEIASAEYITFLDPDNEAVNDGYTLLMNEITTSEDIDIVIGNMIKFDNQKKSNFNYYQTITSTIGSDMIDHPKAILEQTDMRAQSIQALVFRKGMVEKENIQMVEGAIGQDTLFFQELLMAATRAKVIDKTIHIYYAAVSGSMTNRIDISFFQKYMILEKERITFLQKTDLLETYMDKRFSFYFKHWYLKRIPLLEEAQMDEALSLLAHIYRLYEEHIKRPDQDIQKFWNHAKNGDRKAILLQCKTY